MNIQMYNKFDIILVDYPDIIKTQKIIQNDVKILNEFVVLRFSILYDVSVEIAKLYLKNNDKNKITLTVDENVKIDLLNIERYLKIRKIKEKINNV